MRGSRTWSENEPLSSRSFMVRRPHLRSRIDGLPSPEPTIDLGPASPHQSKKDEVDGLQANRQSTHRVIPPCLIPRPAVDP